MTQPLKNKAPRIPGAVLAFAACALIVSLCVVWLWSERSFFTTARDDLKVGMAPQDVADILGSPNDVFTIAGTGEVWYYTPSWIRLSTRREHALERESELPYGYDKLILFFSAGQVLEAMICTAGETSCILTPEGYIPGETIAEYFAYRNARQ